MLLKSKGFRDYIKQNTPELGKRKSACLHETWSLGRTLTSDDIAPRVFMELCCPKRKLFHFIANRICLDVMYSPYRRHCHPPQVQVECLPSHARKQVVSE